MKLYLASSPSVEVNGDTLFSVFSGLGAFKIIAVKTLAENGIMDLKSGKWYSQQAFLNSLRSLAEKYGDSILFNIGMMIPVNAIFPENIMNIQGAFSLLDEVYHMNHRGGDIGNYMYEKTGERSCKMICTNPYPDEFDNGIITGLCKKYKGNFSLFNVEIKEQKTIRSNGGDSTTFTVNWK